MHLVLLGPPGAGKGTQGQALALHFGVPHVASGDLIRNHIERGTEFGKEVEAATAAGNFVPDKDILYWIGRRLLEPDAAAGFVLDGFPRDLAQAQAFKWPLNAVVELVLAEDAVIKRLAGRMVCSLCGAIYNTFSHLPRVNSTCDLDGEALIRRPDDESDAIRRRLVVYHRMTLPLREYYVERDLLLSVDAAGTVDEVQRRILKSLSVGTLR